MKTEIIVGGRGVGKTTELIKRSAETRQYIMVSNSQRARHIFEQAKSMDLYIPFPVTIHEMFSSRFRGSCIRRDGLLIDDFEDVVCEIFSGIPVNAITLTEREYSITRMSAQEVENNEN